MRQILDGHYVLGLDLQPGSNGNIFASACDGDGELRVYDVRSKDAGSLSHTSLTLISLILLNDN